MNFIYAKIGVIKTLLHFIDLSQNLIFHYYFLEKKNTSNLILQHHTKLTQVKYQETSTILLWTCISIATDIKLILYKVHIESPQV